MAKFKTAVKKEKRKKGRETAHTSYERDEEIDPSTKDYIYDEVDTFTGHGEFISLDHTDKGSSSSEKEVLGLESDSDDSIYDLLDIPKEEKNTEKDERIWGNKASYYGYNTTGHLLDLAQAKGDFSIDMEVEAARRLQNRMIAELQGLSFGDLIVEPEEQKGKKSVEAVCKAVDVDSLSKKQRLRMLQEQSPEFIPLIEDFQAKKEEVESLLEPLMDGLLKYRIPLHKSCIKYLRAKFLLNLNYICVLSAYVMLKCSGATLSEHRVIVRLAQYRHLLKELEPLDEALGPVLKKRLQEVEQGIYKRREEESRCIPSLPLYEHSPAVTKDRQAETMVLDSVSNINSDDKESKSAVSASEGMSGDKRKATEQIVRNKGLTPYRKKSEMNPRLKYKRKYKNKIKKRKSQVKEHIKEISKYMGERTGIKKDVIKSVKLQ